MGVYIKDMEIPASCSRCGMLEGSYMDGLCHAANRWLDDDEYWTWYVYPEGDIDGSKPCNCPLAPVPPHGRLIDADALREDWLENGENEYVYDTNAFLDSLDGAPTIIEAEEGET